MTIGFATIIFLFGVLLGCVVGMTSIGKGLIGTPVLILLGIPKFVAVGTIGVAGIFMMASSAYKHWRNGNVDMRIVLLFSLSAIPASFVFAGIKEMVNRVVDLKYLIAIAILASIAVMGYRMFRRTAAPGAVEDREPARSDLLAVPLLGIALGFLIGTTSISGSLIFIAFALILRMPDRVAVGTTNFVAIFSLMAASTAHIWHGQVDWLLFAVFTPAVMLGAFVGAQLTNRVPQRVLRSIILVLLFLAAMAIFFKADDGHGHVDGDGDQGDTAPVGSPPAGDDGGVGEEPPAPSAPAVAP